jgi:hypothetical protein
MRELESRLQQENPRYRRIWIQYSTHRGLRVLLTLFPMSHEDYRMVHSEAKDLTYESINEILQKDLVISN